MAMERNILCVGRRFVKRQLLKSNASDHLPAGGPARATHRVHTPCGAGQVHCVVRQSKLRKDCIS